MKKTGTYQEKIFYIQRQKRNHNETVGRVHLWYNQIPTPPKWGPTNCRIIIFQKFSHRNESSEPHIRLLSLGVWHQEKDPPEHLALKGRGTWLQELHRTGGNRDSTLGRCIQTFMHTKTQGKSSDFIGVWARPTCWFAGSPGESGVAVALSEDIKAEGEHILIWRLTSCLGP